MAEYHFKTPLSEEDVRKLHLRDIVYLSGIVYSGTSLVSRLIEAIKKGERLPFDLKGAVFSYGFTTSARYQVPMHDLIKFAGIRAITGKGSVYKPVLDAMKTYGCVYLSGVGGSADVYRRPGMVGEPVATEWPDLSKPIGAGGRPTNLVTQKIKDYGPLFITMDAHGHSVETEIKIEERMPKIYKRLGVHDVYIPYHF